MSFDLSLLRVARDLAAHASARQSVIAQNVANADTPGYRARDIAPFSEFYADSRGMPPRATRPGHAGADPGAAPDFRARLRTSIGAASPNGNTVSLEDQMLRAAEIKGKHDLALGVMRKTLDLLRLGLGRGR